ncbi:MAG: ExbD/TolR family protein [Spirochaetota bacterium]
METGRTRQILIRLLHTLYGRDTKRRQQRTVFGAEASSMGDVAFLLLIFFIVTTSFILRQGIFFTLPSKSGGAQRIEEERLIKIYPTEDGFMYNQAAIQGNELITQLKKRFQTGNDPVVLIYMPDDLAYERLVKTLCLVKESGITKVSVKTKEESS